MKSVLWLLLGLVVGGIVGWYVRGLGQQGVRASTKFAFNDHLADSRHLALREGSGEVAT
jgi:hypothetical protein